MSLLDAPVRCPRCDGRLVLNHDELICLVHGTVYEPHRAWDAASFPITAPGERKRRSDAENYRGRTLARIRAELASIQ